MVRDLRRTEYGSEFVAEVLESRPLTPTTHHIRVQRPREFEFRPVQFTFLSLRTERSDAWEDYRPMSLASSPTRPYLEYGVRLSGTPFKRAFAALRPGDEVMVEGPRGNFVLDTERPAVFVAGGIGVTPLKGMIEYATDTHVAHPLRLVYSNRDLGEIAYGSELDALAMAHTQLRVVHTLTREADPTWRGRRGRIDADLLAEVSQGLEDATYYVCGAPGMVDAVKGLLRDGLGVARGRVHAEEFWGYG